MKPFLPALGLLAILPAQVSSEDDESAPGSIPESVSELVDSIGPVFDCDITIVSVKAQESTGGAFTPYIVLFEARGVHCHEAHQRLNEKGKSKGIWFRRSIIFKRIDKPPSEPNLDLIYEINPPIGG